MIKDSKVVNDFAIFLQIACRVLSRPDLQPELRKENAKCDQIVDACLKASEGKERYHVVMALVMLVNMVVEDANEHDKLMARPVI